MSKTLQDLLKKKFPPQMGGSQQKKLHDSKIKEVRDAISMSKTKQKIAENDSKRQNEAVQNELNNSKESSLNIRGSKFTVHTNSKGKIVGYSKEGSNTVNMAGMPPVGPGVRIKTKPKSKASELQSTFKNIRGK